MGPPPNTWTASLSRYFQLPISGQDTRRASSCLPQLPSAHSFGIRLTSYPFCCHIAVFELMIPGCSVDTSVSWKTPGVHTGGVSGFGVKGPCPFKARKIDETLVERWDPCSGIVRLKM